MANTKSILVLTLTTLSLSATPSSRFVQSAARWSVISMGACYFYDQVGNDGKKVQHLLEKTKEIFLEKLQESTASIKEALAGEHDTTRTLLKKQHDEIKKELKNLRTQNNRLYMQNLKLERELSRRINRSKASNYDLDEKEKTDKLPEDLLDHINYIFSLSPHEDGYLTDLY